MSMYSATELQRPLAAIVLLWRVYHARIFRRLKLLLLVEHEQLLGCVSLCVVFRGTGQARPLVL